MRDIFTFVHADVDDIQRESDLTVQRRMICELANAMYLTGLKHERESVAKNLEDMDFMNGN